MQVRKDLVGVAVALGLLSGACLALVHPGSCGTPAVDMIGVSGPSGQTPGEEVEPWRTQEQGSWKTFDRYWHAVTPGVAPWEDPVEKAPVIVCGVLSNDRTEEETDGPAFGLTLKGRWHVMEMAVDHAIKGADLNTSDIHVKFFAPKTPPIHWFGPAPYFLLPDVRYLLFLKHAESPNEYCLLQGREYMPPPLPLAPKPPLDEQASAKDRLIAELIATARQEAVELAGPAIPVLGFVGRGDQRAVEALKELAAKDEPNVAIPAIHSLTLWREKDEALLRLLEELTRKDAVDISGSAIAARLRLGDISAVSEAASWAEWESLPEFQVLDIAGGIGSRSFDKTDERLRPALEWLARSKVVQFRQSAVWALRPLATRDLIPTLIKLLDDPDLEVQLQAMRDLYDAAEGSNNVLVKYDGFPVEEVFRRVPDHYISFWKAWWAQGGKVVPPVMPSSPAEVLDPDNP